MTLRYKFVELSTVTDEAIEEAVNRTVEQGWRFDTIHFVTRDNSPRPCMAFLSFLREGAGEDDDDPR
ncbi:MAG: DUF4177 domain-containing protein [Deltaproteobacteria bacterium]|nr:DUF4177 domain-containing protein [Deltaproteobacteria bacterium]MBW2531017.1 DUF4177 domain-containing protein [Deltaproteobacteria bacterium]